jgi:ZIP family zinc transporter
MNPEAAALLLAVTAAAATLLGWVAVALKRTWTPRSVGISLLLAASAMLIISVGELLLPGLLNPATRVGTAVLALSGIAVVPMLRAALHRMAPGVADLERSAVLVMMAILVHNIPEGSVPFAAAMLSLGTGVVTAVAIGLHNIPEGMAVAAAVIAADGTRLRALAFTVMAMGGEILGALLALFVTQAFTAGTTAGLLAFVAGIMVAISVLELIPSGLARLNGEPGSGIGASPGPVVAPDEPTRAPEPTAEAVSGSSR